MKTVEERRRELAEKEAEKEAEYQKRGLWKALFGVISSLVVLYFELARTDMNHTSVILIVGAAALGFLIFIIWLFRKPL